MKDRKWYRILLRIGAEEVNRLAARVARQAEQGEPLGAVDIANELNRIGHALAFAGGARADLLSGPALDLDFSPDTGPDHEAEGGPPIADGVNGWAVKIDGGNFRGGIWFVASGNTPDLFSSNPDWIGRYPNRESALMDASRVDGRYAPEVVPHPNPRP